LSDKLKKKQESFQRLQTEKEALYNDSRTKIDEINQRKEEELKAVNIRLQKLQSDLTAANQAAAELREQLQSKDKEHELARHTLKDQVTTAAAWEHKVHPTEGHSVRDQWATGNTCQSGLRAK
ncbi:hypothetical protein GOODEAATRI_028540, partial [Goodea atripinnis]